MRGDKRLTTLALRVCFLGAGAASVLAFAPYDQFWLAWLCLLPLFSTRAPAPWYQRFADGFLYGLGFYGVGLYWLPEAATSYASFGPIAGFATYAALIAFLALFPALFKWAMSYASGRCWAAIAFAPALWLVLESLRRNAWGGFPWLSLGATQLDGPFAPLIPLIGQPGMVLIVVAINGAVYTLACHWRSSAATPMRDPRLASVAVLLALCSVALVSDRQWTEPQGAPKQIGILATNVDSLHSLTPAERNKLWARYRRRAAQLSGEPDLLVLPEAALGSTSAPIVQSSGNGGAADVPWLLGSVRRTLGGDHYNSAVLVDPPHRALYRKRRLVPFAEDRTSWLAQLMLSRRGTSILPGQIQGPMTVGAWRLGIAICWEIRFGSEVAPQVRRGAEVIINQSNQSWLDSRIAEQRALAAVRMRAAETGRPIVRVANSGMSAHITRNGSMGKGPIAVRGSPVMVSVQPRSGLTPYSSMKLNERLRRLALLIVFLGVVIIRLAGRREARRPTRNTPEAMR